MNRNPDRMKAAALQRFGGPEELRLQEIDVPHIGPEEVLIRVAYAGVGAWDAFERQGGYAELLSLKPEFPYILGSEGAGTVVAMGENVSNVNMGDVVYGPAFLNPKGGFYAEYAAAEAKYVSRIPDGLTRQEAAVLSGVGITALRGLEDVLKLQQGESVMIFGASGGIGHMAVQLARIIGARVFGVASGEDGAAMVKELGCDSVVDGKGGDITSAAKEFAPEGFDAALFTAGGEAADQAAALIRAGGRAAYPHGIHPELQVPSGIRVEGYHGQPEADIISRLHRYIIQEGLTVHIDHMFALEEAREAHDALNSHYLGKICLEVRS